MTIKPGDSLFLDPDSFQLKLDWIVKKERNDEDEDQQQQQVYDEEEYPEKYRKTDMIKGSNSDTPDPFCIGHVVSIACSAIVSKSKKNLINYLIIIIYLLFFYSLFGLLGLYFIHY